MTARYQAETRIRNLRAHADALAGALEKLIMERHYHVSLSGSVGDDACDKCGFDLRNPIHYREGERYDTDKTQAKAALTAYRNREKQT